MSIGPGTTGNDWLAGEEWTPLVFVGAWLMVAGMVIAELRTIVRSLVEKVMG